MRFTIRWVMGTERTGDDSLDDERHRSLALWAADCAEHVLSFFESERPDDDRPRQAIEATRGWAGGDLSASEARTCSLAADAAAREASTAAAREAAHAASHAAATVEGVRHGKGAANAAIKATVAADTMDDRAAETEADWQAGQLPSVLRPHLFIEERPD